MSLNETIGKNITAFRKRLRYSQEEISSFLGISQPAYVKYESGATVVPMESLARLSDLYNVYEYDFMEENEELVLPSLACAYRREGVLSDLTPISEFQKIVKNYIVMCNELEKK